MTEPEIFVPVNSEDFEPPPDEPRWGGSGPTDKNAPVITDAD